jgi:hypothetical protein
MNFKLALASIAWLWIARHAGSVENTPDIPINHIVYIIQENITFDHQKRPVFREKAEVSPGQPAAGLGFKYRLVLRLSRDPQLLGVCAPVHLVRPFLFLAHWSQ